MNSIATRDNYVEIKNIKRQHKSAKTSVFMLRQSSQNQANSRRVFYCNTENLVATFHFEFTTLKVEFRSLQR